MSNVLLPSQVTTGRTSEAGRCNSASWRNLAFWSEVGASTIRDAPGGTTVRLLFLVLIHFAVVNLLGLEPFAILAIELARWFLSQIVFSATVARGVMAPPTFF